MRAHEFTSIDPQMVKLQNRLRSHYPQFRQDSDKQFNKYVARALQHAEAADTQQTRDIAQLKKEISRLKKEIDQPEEKLNELTFMGSQCTKDCSGHRAGYEWSVARGRRSAASWSPSFNKGAQLAATGH